MSKNLLKGYLKHPSMSKNLHNTLKLLERWIDVSLLKVL